MTRGVKFLSGKINEINIRLKEKKIISKDFKKI